MYRDGRGVAQDAAEAAHLYRGALRSGDGGAEFRLGQLCEKGAGVPADRDRAIDYYQWAAADGHAEAAAAAARLGAPSAAAVAYDAAIERWNAQDYGAARAQLEPLAAQGHADALRLLGRMYDGSYFGVEKDRARALDLYRQAAKAGSAEAQYALARAYDEGDGVAEDKAEAARWYRAAAERGDVSAQHRLAVMLEGGEGVAADLAEAKAWYRRAAYQHDQKALWALRRLAAAEPAADGSGRTGGRTRKP
jgi:hypothetical protein